MHDHCDSTIHFQTGRWDADCWSRHWWSSAVIWCGVHGEENTRLVEGLQLWSQPDFRKGPAFAFRGCHFLLPQGWQWEADSDRSPWQKGHLYHMELLWQSLGPWGARRSSGQQEASHQCPGCSCAPLTGTHDTGQLAPPVYFQHYHRYMDNLQQSYDCSLHFAV